MARTRRGSRCFLVDYRGLGQADPLGRVGLSLWAGVVAALITAGPVSAAEDPALRVTASVSPDRARPGEHGVVEVRLEIPDGFHVYGTMPMPGGPKATKVTLTAAGLEPEGPWYGPMPELLFDKGFGKKLPTYHGRVTLARPVGFSGPPGPGEGKVSVYAQMCDDSRCLVQRITADLRWTLEPGGVRLEHREPVVAFPGKQPLPEPQGEVKGVTPSGGEGILGFIIAAFVAGFLALVTPCVFPMIPLTVSFFSKASEERFGRGLFLAGVYALSIIASFTAVGVVVSLVFGAAGIQRFAAHPVFNLAVALLLVVFGLSLMGWFELRMPYWIVDRSERLKARYSGKGPGVLSVFFMALTFTLVSFTCTVGFVGVVLVAAAQGDWFWPTVGMLAFSTAFALPFFFLALFPQAAKRLQGKSGDWLPLVKVMLGTLEIAAAFKFFSNADLVLSTGLLPRAMVLGLWIGLFVVAALYLLKAFRFTNEPEGEPVARLSVPRAMAAAVVIGVVAYLSAGLFSGEAFGNWIDGWLPPVQASTGHRAAKEGQAIPWLHGYDQARAEARAKGRNLFLNFTGVTCTNCRYMEEGILPRPEIAEHITRFVPVELYTDRDLPEDRAASELQRKLFGTVAVPFYAVVTPEGEILGTFPGSTNDAAEFLAFIERLPHQAGEGGGGEARSEEDPRAVADDRRPGLGRAGGPGDQGTEPGHPESGRSDHPSTEGLDFALPYLFEPGKTFHLSELRGKTVVLNHWATWCSPCRRELSTFFPEVVREFRERGVVLVTIAYDGGDEDFEAQARDFIRQHVDGWPALLAPQLLEDVHLPASIKPQGFPTTQIVYPTGEVLWNHAKELTEEQLRGAIQAALTK